jgi:hypothetical protein
VDCRLWTSGNVLIVVMMNIDKTCIVWFWIMISKGDWRIDCFELWSWYVYSFEWTCIVWFLIVISQVNWSCGPLSQKR